MPTIYEGTFAPPSGRFALIAARFNSAIVEPLVAGALDGLKRHGVADDAIDIVRVPGSFEIPFVAQRLASSGKYEDNFLPSGLPAGSPEDCLNCAGGLYLDTPA